MTQEEARAALEKLRAWAQVASPTEIAELDPAIARLISGQEVSNYPDLSREYQSDFVVDPAYKATLPDLQNGPDQPDQRGQKANPARGDFQFPPADHLSHP